MPRAVIFGAGNIGRGFLGQIFAESGYDLVFIEANAGLAAELNRRGRYPIDVVSDDEVYEITVDRVRAVSCRDPAAARELAEADLAATAVGVNALARVAGVIAAALPLRASDRPLDVIICENLLDADEFLKTEVSRRLPAEAQSLLDSLGLVEASIGRMVPAMTQDRRLGDPLRVRVEPYCELPVDAGGFRGPIPKLAHLVPCQPFDYYIQCKLFLHNAGHALAAYLGYLSGYAYIWQVMLDQGIHADIGAGMTECARALSLEHGRPLSEVLAHADDLRRRFANRALGDTVARVGRDPLRKLGPEDRLVGAARLIEKHGGQLEIVAKGIAAALLFQVPGDEGAERLQQILHSSGLERTLEKVCGLEIDGSLANLISHHFRGFS